MDSKYQAKHRVIRQTRISHALTLALALGAAAGASAAPDSNAEAWAELLYFADEASDANTEANVTAVTNCDDAGPGSLRNQVGQAGNGDVIDLSQLGCTDIVLTSGAMQIDAENLVLKGWLDPSDPDSPQRPRIRRATSAAPFRIFFHTGAGQLQLTNLHISSGEVSVTAFGGFGGCIRSSGSVRLVSSAVVDCQVTSIGGVHPARGGGVYALKNVRVDGKSLVDRNTATGHMAGAEGGGVYSAETTKVDSDAVIKRNRVISDNAHAHGGGIFAGDGLTMTGGRLEENRAGDNQAAGGGAFVSDGQVLMMGSIVSGNTVYGSGARGAGLNFGGNNNEIKYSTIDNNSTNHIGGGIFAKNGLTLKGSSVSGNTGSANGGGIYAGGTMVIERSTIAGNTSTRVAGADLGTGAASDSVVIKQSTISGNKSGNSKLGTGLFLRAHSEIRNSTITGNIERNAQNERYGAGITMSANRTLELSSTIITGNHINVDGTFFGSDIGFSQSQTGSLSITGSHNMIGNRNPGIQVPGDSMMLPDPLLGPLQDNGGPTKTHMPLMYSSAIDHGKANGFANDQRGSGYPRVLGVAADIGAVEHDPDRIFYNGFQ